MRRAFMVWLLAAARSSGSLPVYAADRSIGSPAHASPREGGTGRVIEGIGGA